MGAAFLSMPGLMLTEDESKNLAKAVAKVQAHYDIAASAKTLAWANLVFVAGGIYGPRVVASFINKEPEATKQGPSLVNIEDAKRARPAAAPDPVQTSPSAAFGVRLGASIP